MCFFVFLFVGSFRAKVLLRDKRQETRDRRQEIQTYNEPARMQNTVSFELVSHPTASVASEPELRNERVLCEYTEDEKEMMNYERYVIIGQTGILKKKGIAIVHENQKQIADQYKFTFSDRQVILAMVIAKTQSGKTGIMNACITKAVEDTECPIPTSHIFIITALSSTEWKEQTKYRTPAILHATVFHRSELPITFVDSIRGKKNVLIIMDEIQIAAKKNQTIYRAFENAGFLNKQYLLENDIKILEFTATPDGTICHLQKWNEASRKIIANPGEGYTSAYDLLQRGRVRQFKNLCGLNKETGEVHPETLDNIREIHDDIHSFSRPRYHIIRTRTGGYQETTIHNFKEVFDPQEFCFVQYDGASKTDINVLLAVAPKKHTFIFIKERLRCAKTIHKTYIGILYERYVATPDDACIMQGLIGRDTGYDNNGDSICYTNIDTIERYEAMWNSGFEDSSIEWNSKTTLYRRGSLSAKNTFNNRDEYAGFSSSDDESVSDAPAVPVEPIIKRFRTQEEGKLYYIRVLKPLLNGNGPYTKKANAQGFYEATVRNVKKVYSCNELYSERRCGIENDSGKTYRFRPCYKDPSDPNTLMWWFIHYPIE